MTRPYSMDLRERVVRAVREEGLSRRQAAKHFKIGVSTAIAWLDREKSTGSAAPAKMGGYKPRRIVGEHHAWLVARCRDGSHFTIAKLIEELAGRGVKIDHHSVWNFLHEQKLTFKKGRWSPASEIAPTSPGVVGNGPNTRP
jgi:putative transposase